MRRADIITAARALVGTPFLWHGRSLQSGLDCGGTLFQVNLALAYAPGVDAELNYNTPAQTHVVDALLNAHWRAKPVADGRPGDVYLMHLPREWRSHLAFKTAAPDWCVHVDASVGRVVKVPLARWLKYTVQVFEFYGVED
jgi:hypothetical protein